ncbi:MAG: hypothetical protein A2029_03450 [Chloroflexi bacterium RBG_19FT_COMBO_47_9]|nr:MAG: hypothetical protein A2029_03450 [Chloroflexi bacterium RBG_19FT_COMBO_47_9]
MSTALKWILYVLLGLVVLAVVAGIVYMVFGGYGYAMMGPGIRWTDHMRFSYNPVRSIFGGLLGLGVFVLVIVGIVALVNAIMHGNRSSQTTPPAQMTAPSRTCSNCGKPAQDEWKTCPYCGNPLT